MSSLLCSRLAPPPPLPPPLTDERRLAAVLACSHCIAHTGCPSPLLLSAAARASRAHACLCAPQARRRPPGLWPLAHLPEFPAGGLRVNTIPHLDLTTSYTWYAHRRDPLPRLPRAPVYRSLPASSIGPPLSPSTLPPGARSLLRRLECTPSITPSRCQMVALATASWTRPAPLIRLPSILQVSFPRPPSARHSVWPAVAQPHRALSRLVATPPQPCAPVTSAAASRLVCIAPANSCCQVSS